MLKELGIKQARQAANPLWWSYMMALGKEICARKLYFTTDDLERLRQERGGPPTHENRAMGPLMLALKTTGICLPVLGDWSPSDQRVNHRRHMQVWQSLIYRGPQKPRPKRRNPIDPRQYDFTFDG